MHDAAPRIQYEPDSVVIDVRDADDEELTMQLMHSGKWHRRDLNLSGIACSDEPTHSQFNPLRRETYEGELCTDGCFTKKELAKSAKLNAERRALEDGETP